MIILAIGLPKSGSSWFFHLINELAVKAGFDDTATIRAKYQLDSILKYGQNIQELSATKLSRLTSGPVGQHTFTVKTHYPPTAAVLEHLASGRIRPILGIRDPRDMAVSAYEAGCAHRAAGRQTNFARISDLPSAIRWARFWIDFCYVPWSHIPGIHVHRYEDMLTDPLVELAHIAGHLELPVTRSDIQKAIEKWSSPLPSNPDHARLHFNRGVAGRHRSVFSADELELAQSKLGDFIAPMGYAAPSATGEERIFPAEPPGIAP